MEVDEVTTAKLDLCREEIEKEYGKEISSAVAKVMSTMMITILAESIRGNLDHIRLLGATTKAILMIDKLADIYAAQVSKARDN